jgi:hypothetical protein
MPLPHAFFGWSFLAVLLAASPQHGGGPCGIPASWDLKAIEQVMPPYATPGRVHVLAWKVVEDDRPLRIESALVLKVMTEGKGARALLAHLYRWPKEKDPEWQLAQTHVTGEPGSVEWPGLMLTHVKDFKTRPKNRDIYAALVPREVNWSFEREEGWKVLGSGICQAVWLEAIGENPTRSFGR